jgi:predicted flap endonuclease-1-like 5' DNA nuclease
VIWHFLEVWLLLLAAFFVGCGLGAAAYAGIGNSNLAGLQWRLADAIGDILDRIKTRFGLGADWRDGVRIPIERPTRQQKPLRRSRKPRFSRYRRKRDDRVLRHDEAIFDEPDRLADVWPDEDGSAPHDMWDGDAEAEEVARRYGDKPDEAEPPMPIVPAAASRPPEPMISKRPAPLLAPRNGVPDNLQRIRGIGKANEELLNSFGIFHFGQIAAWTPAEAQWVAERMPFPERIDRDDWIGQATILASGGHTGYTKSAERRRAKRLGGPSGEDDEDET